MRLSVTNTRENSSLLLADRVVRQFIIRIRPVAIVQTTVLAATCSILVSVLGSSPAQADMTMDSYEAQATVAPHDEPLDSFSGLKCHRNEGLLSAGGRTLNFITDFLSQKTGGTFKLSTGQRPAGRNSLTASCGYDPLPLNGNLGWHQVIGDLNQVMVSPFGGDNFFTVVSVPFERTTILIDVGRRRDIDDFFFDVGRHSEVGDVLQSKGFDIDVSFNF